MPNELKPCPFCGGKAEIYNEGGFGLPKCYVQCEKCKARTYVYVNTKGNFKYMKCAIKAWNRRADNV